MIGPILLLFLVIALHNAIFLSAGRPRKDATAFASPSSPDIAATPPSDPFSASEREVAHFLSSGGLAAGVPPLPLSLQSSPSHPKRRGRKRRERKANEKASSEIEHDKGAEVDLMQNTAPICTIDKATLKEGQCDNSNDHQEPIIPVYLNDVPPTKAGKLFEEHERQYWEARRKGLVVYPGNGVKFFKCVRLPLTRAEKQEYRDLARRFSTKLQFKTAKRRAHNEAYRLRRFGPRDPSLKTEEQKRETKRRTRKTYLIRRLKKCLASHTRQFWTENHCRMLRELVEDAPLEPDEQLVDVYRSFLGANKGMQSCIALPD